MEDQTPVQREKRTIDKISVENTKRRNEAAAIQKLCRDIPDAVNCADDGITKLILNGIPNDHLENILTNIIEQYGTTEEDEQYIPIIPKFSNSETDPFTSWDFYKATGCPMCGELYDFTSPSMLNDPRPVLRCYACGHIACSMRESGESDILIDQLRFHLEKNVPAKTKPAYYMRGIREVYHFEKTQKLWWKKKQQEQRGKSLLETDISNYKAPTTKELCEHCGHDEAFFTTYQARSADEGTTIMYECTRCHKRKTFNN